MTLMLLQCISESVVAAADCWLLAVISDVADVELCCSTSPRKTEWSLIVAWRNVRQNVWRWKPTRRTSTMTRSVTPWHTVCVLTTGVMTLWPGVVWCGVVWCDVIILTAEADPATGGPGGRLHLRPWLCTLTKLCDSVSLQHWIHYYYLGKVF